MAMTSKERVIMALNHKEADRVPKYDCFWFDTIENFYKQGLSRDIVKNYPTLEEEGLTRIIGDPVRDYFDFDFDMLSVDASMRLTPEILEENDEYVVMKDRHGFIAKDFKKFSSTVQFIDFVTKTKEDWEKFKGGYVFDPNDTCRIDNDHYFLRTKPYPSWDYMRRIVREYRKRDRFLIYDGYGPFEGAWRHRGHTEALVDIVDDPEWAFEMFGAVVDLTIQTLQYAIDNDMKPDGYWVVEDLCYNAGPFMSPESYRKVIFPHHRRLADYLHKNGMYFFYHCCGNVYKLLPHFIDAGMDCVHPLQASANLDIIQLKKEFDKDITFWGNIEETKLTGSFEEIEKEIARKIPVAMKDGGYIYHSDHSIPPTISFQNFSYAMKMLDKYGTYKK